MMKPPSVSYGPVGQLAVEHLGHLRAAEQPGDVLRHPVGDDLGRLAVVLVLDLPDELLDAVLQRDDPVGAAVLVDDDGEVGVVLPHVGQGR